MSAPGICRACCLGTLSARLPAGLPRDAVAIPARLGESVLCALDAATWLTTPHQLNGPCGDPKVWRRRPETGGRVLPVTDLRRAMRLAYPAFRRRATGTPVQHSNPGGIL